MHFLFTAQKIMLIYNISEKINANVKHTFETRSCYCTMYFPVLTVGTVVEKKKLISNMFLIGSFELKKKKNCKMLIPYRNHSCQNVLSFKYMLW